VWLDKPMNLFEQFAIALSRLTFNPSSGETPCLDLKDPRVRSFSHLGELMAKSVDFSEAALIEDKGVYQQILDLLASATGKLSRLNWLFFEDGDEGEDDFIFRGQAAQALSSVKYQYYAFAINGRTGQMVYKLTNPKEATEFAETEEAYEFAASNKKKLNCKSGNIQCGGRCQNGSLNCFHDMTPKQKQAAGIAAESARAIASVKSAPPPPPSYVRADELKKQRDALVKHLGEDKVAAAEASIKSSVDEAEVYIRVGGSDTLEKILGDRFKTQFETGTSAGDLDPESRAASEKWMFGYDEDKHPKEKRPLYAYLCRPSVVASTDWDNETEGMMTTGYGDIAIRLKSEVKNRATVTGDDSLYMGYLPSPVNSPSLVSFNDQDRIERLTRGTPDPSTLSKVQAQTASLTKAKNLQETLQAVGGSSYVEVQIHNQVRASDIAEIIYMRRSPTPAVVA
jgi:hypothetical protein